MAKKIAIVSTDWAAGLVYENGMPVPGGANFIRLQQWIKYTDFNIFNGTFVYHEKKGIGVIDLNGRIHHDLDAIIMQRLMFKDIKYILRGLKKQKMGPYIINDLDDWYWGLDPSNAAYESCQPGNNPDENINHYKEILKESNLITVSTPFLEERMKNWVKHKSVIKIDNCVDVSMFTPRVFRSKKPVIGWCGSTAHRSKDLEELQGIFSSFYKFQHTGHSSHAPSFAEAIGVNPGAVRLRGPLPPSLYGKKGFSFDIGIAPLSDKPFNHAKSWIKAIEYAAASIPFIASPLPEYLRLREEYGIGRIAETPDDWLRHIHELHDPKLRTAEGRECRKVVSEHLNVQNMAERWTEILEQI